MMTKYSRLALLALSTRAFMSDAPLATVIVKGADGEPMMINESDYHLNPTAYSLIDPLPSDAPTPKPAAPDATTTAVAAGKVLVVKEGTGAKTRFYLTDESGAKLSGDGIAEAGYDTDALAWAAVIELSKTA